MAAAILGAITDVVGLTTTPKPHVLWPLYACLGLFISGFTFFALRQQDLPLTSTVITDNWQVDPGRQFADATPAEMQGVFKEHTTIQAHKLVEPHLGKWVRLTGSLRDVSKWHGTFAQVTLDDYNVMSDVTVFMYFTDKEVVDGRLAALNRGVEMTIVGKVERISASHVDLTECEIESVQRRRPVVTNKSVELTAAGGIATSGEIRAVGSNDSTDRSAPYSD